MLKGAPRHDGIPGARTMRTVLRVLNATLPTLALGAALGAQDTTYRPAQLFDRRAVAITMRDGVRLRTLIYTPKGAAQPLPILLERSPYPFGPDSNPGALRWYRELVEDGYIVVLQYIRGRYGSEGRFVQPEQMPHGHVPHRRDPKAVDESTDAYDTIDWLVNNVSGHNGRVGVIGTSYDGWLALMATVDPHPALAAAAPHASPGDMLGADDWYHNGAFRLAPSYAFAVMMAGDTMLPLRFDRADTYEWFLQAGTLSAITRRHASGSLPLWDVLLAHPERDAYVEQQDVTTYIGGSGIPTLSVVGFWDAEDYTGPLRIYQALERHDTAGVNHLVLGPWRHGSWFYRAARDTVAQILTGGNGPAQDLRDLLRRWMAHHLRRDAHGRAADSARGSNLFPEALVYQTGSNRWETYDPWPPRIGVTQQRLYFREEEQLSFGAPRAPTDRAYDSFVSDPDRPVPYTPRPITGFWESTASSVGWKVEDQRFVHNRPDVLSWETPPLAEDVTVTGRVVAHLFASSTGTDADWIVKLIDVYPDSSPARPAMAGYQLMIADEVIRAKYHRNPAKPAPLVPGRVAEYVIDLGERNHRFLKGHRIMVQIQSTWFPLIDRNPQTFVNIPMAKATDYRPATHRVYRSAKTPSHVRIMRSCADAGVRC